MRIGKRDKKKKKPILIEVTRRPQALRTTPMLLAVTPLPSPLTTPPVTKTYFIFVSLKITIELIVNFIVASGKDLKKEEEDDE